MSRAVEVPQTLHPFTAGCIWKMLARRRQAQPDVIRSVERAHATTNGPREPRRFDQPPSSATSTTPLASRTVTGARVLDATTGAGLASCGGSMLEPTVLNQARARAAARDAWLRRTGRRHDPDDPGDRSSQMLLSCVRDRARDRNARTRPAVATYRHRAKGRDATMTTKKPPPRSRVIRVLPDPIRTTFRFSGGAQRRPLQPGLMCPRPFLSLTYVGRERLRHRAY